MIHPTLLKGMANSIGSNTLTNTITRTANVISPGFSQAVSGVSGIATVPGGIAGVPAGTANILGEIQGIHAANKG